MGNYSSPESLQVGPVTEVVLGQKVIAVPDGVVITGRREDTSAVDVD